MPVVSMEPSVSIVAWLLVVVVSLQVEGSRFVARQFQAHFEVDRAAASWLFGVWKRPGIEPLIEFDPYRPHGSQPLPT